jgi:hypothetical protein
MNSVHGVKCLLINSLKRLRTGSTRSITASHILEIDPPEVSYLLIDSPPAEHSIRWFSLAFPVNQSQPLSTRTTPRERHQGSEAASPAAASVLSPPTR